MRYLNKFLKFQKPLLVNAAHFQHLDEDLCYPMFSESEDSDQATPASKHSESELDEAASAQPSSQKQVAPSEPDESKWDKIFVLPLFAKPGKHTYMIKYKNVKESKQRRTIKETARVK